MKALNILLEITIYAGILFCAIMLLKLCFKNRMSPFLHFVIWGLLIARLLVPVTLESAVHLFVVPAETNAVIQQQAPVANTDTTNNNASDTGQAQTQENADKQKQNVTTPSTVADNTMTAPQALTLSTEEILLAVWLTGAGIGLIYLAALYGLLRRRIRKNAQAPSKRLLALFAEVKAELNIRRNVRIIGQCEYGTPAVLFPGTVLMPVGTLVSMSDDEVKFVLRHELMHFKRHDHILGLVLSVLNAVYWFNPLVWIAFKQIRADMETACDSEVVRYFSSDEKSAYAAVILSLFSKKQYGNLVLGMVQGNTRKIVEKRIKGVFMHHKSNNKVKVTAVLLTSVLLFTCFTTACQPTPENAIVVNKGDGALQEKIYNEGETIGKPYEAPATWQDKISEGVLNLFIDAHVETPKTNGLPVALIEPDEITDGDAANILKGLTEGKPIIALQTQITKEVLEAEILEIKQVINDPNSDFNAVTKKEDPERYKLRLKELQERLDLLTAQHKDAPESQSKSEIELRFIPETEIYPRLAELNDPFDGLGIAGYTEKDGVRYQEVSLKKPARTPYYDQRIDYYKLGFGGIEPFLTSTTSNLRNCNLTLDEARNIAEEFLNRLDIQDMGLSLAASTIQYNPEYDEEKGIINEFSQSYVLHYTRKVNGVQITHQLNQPDPSEQYDTYWSQELIIVAVNDSGVTQFSWVSPISVKDIINSNVELLPFSEIQDIFKRNIGMNIDYLDNDPSIIGREIHINRVVLGLTKIKQKDSSEHILVPSWNFFGYEVNKYDGPQPGGYILDENNTFTQEAVGQSYLTINAIDGSLINTNIGY